MAELILLRGQVAVVDDEDLPKIQGRRWILSANGYVICMTGPKCSRKTTWLHRLIAGTPNGFDTDHKNRNKLDNRKQNLRTATRRQNTGNRVKQCNGKTSKFKGVHWHNVGKGYWRARFHSELGSKHLGLFDSEEDAARAYDLAAVEHFGKNFALLNLP